MAIKVILWTKPRADGLRHIKINLHHNGHDYYGLELYVHEKDFNFESGRVKKSHPNQEVMNSNISNAYHRFENLTIKYPKTSVRKIIELYDGTTSGSATLIEYLEDFIEKCKAGKINNPRTGMPLKENTYKGYGNLLTRLTAFTYHERRVDFADIDMQFYEQYVYYLRFTKKLAENSIGTDIKNLKSIMGRAVSDKLTDNLEYKRPEFRVIDEEVDSIALSPEEVEAISKVSEKKYPHLVPEKERFLIAYNFLLRFNDSLQIGKGNIIENKKGRFLHIRTTKTGERVLVPIMPKTWTILEKNNFQMPVTTNQESNWKLKELGKHAKITEEVTIYEHRQGKTTPKVVKKNELISTHTCRRSAATNMYEAGVPTKAIMDMGGWETEEEFFKYIRIKKKKSAEEAAQHSFFK